MKILIDPGHGGIFSGATHTQWGWSGRRVIREAYINLRAALMLGHRLTRLSLQPLFTRTTDNELREVLDYDLQARCDIERRWGPDCFVSLHCDSWPDARAHGITVYTSPGDTPADPLAERVIQRIEQAFPDHKIRRDTTDGDSDKEAKYKVLTGTSGPAILVEMEFLSSPKGRSLLLDPTKLGKMSQAIAEGVGDWGT